MKKFILLTVLSLFISASVWAESETVVYSGLSINNETKSIVDKCDKEFPAEQIYNDKDLGENTIKINDCLKKAIYEQLNIINVEEPKKKEIVELLKNDQIYKVYDSIINHNEKCLKQSIDISGCGTMNKYLNNTGSYNSFLVSLLDLIISQKQ